MPISGRFPSAVRAFNELEILRRLQQDAHRQFLQQQQEMREEFFQAQRLLVQSATSAFSEVTGFFGRFVEQMATSCPQLDTTSVVASLDTLRTALRQTSDSALSGNQSSNASMQPPPMQAQTLPAQMEFEEMFPQKPLMMPGNQCPNAPMQAQLPPAPTLPAQMHQDGAASTVTSQLGGPTSSYPSMYYHSTQQQFPTQGQFQQFHSQGHTQQHLQQHFHPQGKFQQQFQQPHMFQMALQQQPISQQLMPPSQHQPSQQQPSQQQPSQQPSQPDNQSSKQKCGVTSQGEIPCECSTMHSGNGADHKRRCELASSLTVADFVNADANKKPRVDTHKTEDKFEFWLDSQSQVPYCAKTKKDGTKVLHGCRRPFGFTAGCCNSSMQQTCFQSTTCTCNSTILYRMCTCILEDFKRGTSDVANNPFTKSRKTG